MFHLLPGSTCIRQVFTFTQVNVHSRQLSAQVCVYISRLAITCRFLAKDATEEQALRLSIRMPHKDAGFGCVNASRVAVMEGEGEGEGGCHTSGREKQFSLFYSEKERNTASNYLGPAMKADQGGS